MVRAGEEGGSSVHGAQERAEKRGREVARRDRVAFCVPDERGEIQA